MSIWFNHSLKVEDIETFGKHTMNEHLAIEFIEVGENFLRAKMPVDHRTKQAYGILHGGASATLAETVGSVGSVMVVDPAKYYCVGVEINANHIRSIKDGYVIGTATPIHLGRSSHVWDIRITDEKERLICIS